MNIKIEYDKEIDEVFISNNNKSIQIDRTEVARIERRSQLMATDRQTPCLYYICAGLCTKARKADRAFITASIAINTNRESE